MVKINRPVTYCDKHNDTEDRLIPGESLIAAIRTSQGLVAIEIDGCMSCFTENVTPFVDFLKNHGRPVNVNLSIQGGSGRVISDPVEGKLANPVLKEPVVLTPIESKKEVKASKRIDEDWKDNVSKRCLCFVDKEKRCGQIVPMPSWSVHAKSRHGLKGSQVPWELVGMPEGVEPVHCPTCRMPFINQDGVNTHQKVHASPGEGRK